MRDTPLSAARGGIPPFRVPCARKVERQKNNRVRIAVMTDRVLLDDSYFVHCKNIAARCCSGSGCLSVIDTVHCSMVTDCTEIEMICRVAELLVFF